MGFSRNVFIAQGVSVLAATMFFAPYAAGQQDPASYPRDSIKIIVCVPAGGGVDMATRIVGEKLRQKLGQIIVIENRGGQAGNIGAEAVATAAPDGYTLLAAQPAPLTVNGLLYNKLNYDPAAFEPVAVLTSIPNALLVRPDFPAKTLQELIAAAKAGQGKLNYASQGNGTTSHLTAEYFQSKTGTKLVHVPYRGTGPALNDLIASHVDLMFVEIAVATQLHQSGKARIIAVASAKRAPTLPDIPTMIEAGIPDFESNTWNAIAAPPGTPSVITEKLNDAINDILNMSDIKAQFSSSGMQTVGGSREAMRKLIQQDIQRWGDVIRNAKISIN